MIKHKPNLFIVGAPKAGTSSLHDYLGRHPRVFMSFPKEPRFFARDVAPHLGFLTLGEYLQIFAEARECEVIGESHVWNLYSNFAAQNIFEFNSSAKIIISLRDPFEYVRSMYQYNRSWLIEDQDTIDAAMNLEVARMNGESIPVNCNFRERLFYLGCSSYAGQVRRYLELFGNQNVLVFTFEEMVIDVETILRRVFGFLGLEWHDLGNFPSKNKTYGFRSETIRRWMIHTPDAMLRTIRALLPVPALRRAGYLGITKLNARKPLSVSLSAKVARILKEHANQQAEQLSSFCDVDLSFWNLGRRN